MNIFKKATVAAVTLLVLLAPAGAFAQSSEAARQVCQGVGQAAGGAACGTGTGPTLSGVVTTAVNFLSLIVGIAAVLVIIFAGFRYITAAGDSSRINGAKDTLLYAIIGLIIAISAQVIVRFVLTRV